MNEIVEKQVELIQPRNRRRRKGDPTPDNRPEGFGTEPVGINIGRRLHDLRIQRRLSLRSLAELSCLNINTLSLIENNRTSPSVATLQQLAGALNVPITSFFKLDAEPNSVVFYHRYQRPQVTLVNGLLEELGGNLAARGAEPFLLRLNPCAEKTMVPAVHTGLEFVYCLEGSLTYWINADTYQLSPGDSLLFEAHLPHRWHNDGSVVSCSLLVLCPSDKNDQPTEQHFAISGLD